MNGPTGESLLHRTARRMQRELARARPPAADRLADPMMHLDHAYMELTAAWQRLWTARRRGWSLAAARLREDLWPHALRLQRHVQEILTVRERPGGAVPGVGVLLAELRQLRDEFDSFEIDPRSHRVSIRTGRLVLDGLDLGPFEVRLRLDRLSRADATCFDCVALEPHPAGGDASVSHPHVKDAALCAGDATAPIASALRDGRIADAFLLVAGVLRTYNPHSAYVAIDEWDGGDGGRCAECGDSAGSGHLYFCEDCERDVCDECTGSCEVCDCSSCRSCLERDRVAAADCCPACRHACEACGRTVRSDHFDTASDLCPQCLERRREEDGQSESNDLQNEDQSHERRQRVPSATDDSAGGADAATAVRTTGDVGDAGDAAACAGTA